MISRGTVIAIAHVAERDHNHARDHAHRTIETLAESQ